MDSGPTKESPAGPDVFGTSEVRAPLKLETFLPYRLKVVADNVSYALSLLCTKPYLLNVPEWRVLVTLGHVGMMTSRDIGSHSRMHKTKVSRAVIALEERGLIARRSNRADLREAPLVLTPEGRAMYEDLASIAIEFARRLADAIEPGDRAAFDRALASLTELVSSPSNNLTR